MNYNEVIKRRINSIPLQAWIANEAIKLKIKPEHLEICKSIENGFYVRLKYNRGKQEQLQRLINEEQIRRQLKGLKKVEIEKTINNILSAQKSLNKLNKKIKII